MSKTLTEYQKGRLKKLEDDFFYYLGLGFEPDDLLVFLIDPTLEKRGDHFLVKARDHVRPATEEEYEREHPGHRWQKIRESFKCLDVQMQKANAGANK